ncbi:MAG: hypothetical protein C6Y22_12105 [Hapalosiphonaceae cyanobacterium JJU2]|nr:MAG: hypothetical protein C6Y22_12105 [Hapalosiphonaceae cyanobacterium JJU2]
MTYAKTPSGKTSKGKVSVRPDSSSVKACFPRTYFEGSKQIKLATGIPNDENWESSAKRLERRLQQELEDGKLDDGNGNFNIGRYQEILEDYGLRAKLRIIKSASLADGQLPPKPELSVLEIWDMYCEYRKNDLSETMHKLMYCGTYTNFIKDAIKAVGEHPIKIRAWLLDNRSHSTVKNLLSALSQAYVTAKRQKLVNDNPFDGLSDGIEEKKQVKILHQDDELEDESDITDKSKAFTWSEAEAILEHVKNQPKIKFLYLFLKFKFLTGCRTGEAIALWFADIKWDKEHIVIRRSYNRTLKIFKPTKNETERFFPMPKNGELWNLLKSIPEGKPNEVVFKNRSGNILNYDSIAKVWSGHKYNPDGIIPLLIKQGKVSKYLRCYNTRHTFITHQIFDLGRDEKIVNAWCEHSQDVSRRHYQDIADRALQINPELPVNNQQIQQTNSEVESLKELVKQQSEQIKALQELIASLQPKLDK